MGMRAKDRRKTAVVMDGWSSHEVAEALRIIVECGKYVDWCVEKYHKVTTGQKCLECT
jgi:hypothetical protein